LLLLQLLLLVCQQKLTYLSPIEHFKNILNQEAPVNKADILPAEETLSVDCKRPSKEEIKKAIKTEKQQGTWSRQYTCRSTQSRHGNIGTNPIRIFLKCSMGLLICSSFVLRVFPSMFLTGLLPFWYFLVKSLMLSYKALMLFCLAASSASSSNSFSWFQKRRAKCKKLTNDSTTC
jgi:hypothetical protein